jgi:hypothetical protein
MNEQVLQQNIGALVIQLWNLVAQMNELKVKADAYEALQVGKKEQIDA